MLSQVSGSPTVLPLPRLTAWDCSTRGVSLRTTADYRYGGGTIAARDCFDQNDEPMISVATRARTVLTRLYFALGVALGAHSTLVGASYYRHQLKRSNTLFILAPGNSITRFTPDTFEHIAAHDSLGINSFAVHHFMPTYSLLETHGASLGLLDFLASHPATTEGLQVLYKGFSSPRRTRLVNFVSNLRQLRALRRGRPWLLKEGYANDIGAPTTVVDLLCNTADDRFYNYRGSVVYCVGLAYKAGYEQVVICGVDFSSAYFYDDNPEYAIDAQKYPFINIVSLIGADPVLTGQVLDAIKAAAGLFSETGRGRVFQLGCDGPLADALPAYSIQA